MSENSSVESCNGLPVGSNLEERGRSALESGLWADCKFLVGEGEEKQEIGACKILLAIASPVFANMFFGSLAEQEHVEVSDIQPDVFKKLLQFIYTHKLDIQSSEEALQVIPAAHKYMMPDLMEKCVPFVKNSLSTDNMKQFYEVMNIAFFYNIEELKEVTIKEVQEKAESALESPEFVNLNPDVLVNLLRWRHMNVKSEVDVINAVIRWATARCEDNNLPVNGSSLKTILTESQILKHLRFLTLSEKELESGPVSVGILTEKEVCALRAYNHSGGDLPISMCPLDRPRKSIHNNGRCTRVRMSKWLQTVQASQFKTEQFKVADNCRPFVLLSVTVPTQEMKGPSNNLQSDFYEEYIEIKVSNLGNLDIVTLSIFGMSTHSVPFGTSVLDRTPTCSVPVGTSVLDRSKKQKLDYCAQGSFKGRVKYRDELTIPLELTPYSQDSVINSKGDQFRVSIIFHVPGLYPEFVTIDNSEITCLQKTGHILAFSCRN